MRSIKYINRGKEQELGNTVYTNGYYVKILSSLTRRLGAKETDQSTVTGDVVNMYVCMYLCIQWLYRPRLTDFRCTCGLNIHPSILSYSHSLCSLSLSFSLSLYFFLSLSLQLFTPTPTFLTIFYPSLDIHRLLQRRLCP